MLSPDALYYINILGLESHVEGGAFRETYRSALTLPQQVLPGSFGGDRAASTSIYFLLQYGQFSAFHRISSDEVWHFYDGAPLHIYEIKPDGSLHTHLLGRDLEAGASFQCVIPAGSWFASVCEQPQGFSLVGCTVAPGFDFADFELAQQQNLTQLYPQHAALINRLTY